MKSIAFIIIFLFSLSCYSQDYIEVSPDEWSFMTDTSAFDGVSRAAFIIGTSNSRYVPTPVLSVNQTDGQSVKVFLAYMPADLCGGSTVLIRFGSDTVVYQLPIAYSYQLKRYTVLFDSTLTSYQFINKLHSNKSLSIRLMNAVSVTDVKFSLNGATTALMKLNQ